jgi:hypothetical protein
MTGQNKVFRATGAVAIASSLTPPTTTAIEIICVKLNLSAAGGAAENFTITINSATAAAYDTIIFSQDMNAVQDLMWLPNQPVPVVNTDVVDFAYANSNTRTYGLEVIYRNA